MKEITINLLNILVLNLVIILLISIILISMAFGSEMLSFNRNFNITIICLLLTIIPILLAVIFQFCYLINSILKSKHISYRKNLGSLTIF